jgi:glycosyltransferase involved in cell wall biosynthesis
VLSDSNPLKVWGFEDGHACGYYRIRQPFEQMRLHGHTADYGIGWNEQAREYPIIVGQRVGRNEALPIWRRLRAGHKLVYETDDDLNSIDPTNFAAYMAHGDVEQDAAWAAIAAAHLVTVTSEPLAEVIRQRHDNVAVVPNHIDAAALDIKRPQRDRVTVGWAGGDSHLRDLLLVAGHLRRFLERNPSVNLHTIGTDFRRPCKLPGTHTGWFPVIIDYYRALDFDVGLAPLAPTTFNMAKSPIKVMEYGALGIPCIASDWGPYHDYIVDGVTGYLVRHEHEWGKRLYELVSDQAMREEMGAAAKAQAARYAIQDGYRKWEAVYRSL